MVHTLDTILSDSTQFDLTHFGLWVSLGIVLIVLALYWRGKMSPDWKV